MALVPQGYPETNGFTVGHGGMGNTAAQQMVRDPEGPDIPEQCTARKNHVGHSANRFPLRNTMVFFQLVSPQSQSSSLFTHSITLATNKHGVSPCARYSCGHWCKQVIHYHLPFHRRSSNIRREIQFK